VAVQEPASGVVETSGKQLDDVVRVRVPRTPVEHQALALANDGRDIIYLEAAGVGARDLARHARALSRVQLWRLGTNKHLRAITGQWQAPGLTEQPEGLSIRVDVRDGRRPIRPRQSSTTGV
jgi:hypothetical protein